ncbi:hypothetical protein [Methylobacterium brachythecii]|uniref:Uncharacterized protein n=2 Tax=Methylobacterium brachythecii TaxID=1176177 RepID=A0A7W6AMW9_9HYPH|nr:hypothetical protein [Methylobacterium brachythecii]MBB3904749.1 hypothetical protein [Methylobacterium brachythecii]
MKNLGDVPSRRLLIECERCRRCGSYSLERLVARHGKNRPLRDFLGLMRSRCAERPCTAQLLVPLELDLDQAVMPTNSFDIDIWTARGSREMSVGRVWHLEIASAAFDRAVSLWPHSIITVRDRWRAVRTHNREEAERRERQEKLLKNLFPDRSHAKPGES